MKLAATYSKNNGLLNNEPHKIGFKNKLLDFPMGRTPFLKKVTLYTPTYEKKHCANVY